MTEIEWLKKYKKKLGNAWNSGCTDKQAASHAGCTLEELNARLNESKELREFRDSKVDRILVKAQQNIAQKIEQGDLKASEWYIEKMERRFGGIESNVPDEDEAKIDEFLDGLTAEEFDEE